MDYGVYGDLIVIYPKPHSIYLSRTITLGLNALRGGPGGSYLGTLGSLEVLGGIKEITIGPGMQGVTS